MFILGQMQTLKVAKIVEHGAYLAPISDISEEALSLIPETEQIESKNILLPRKEATSLKVGDEVEVFIYKDSEDRPIATRVRPLLCMGEIVRLKVKDISNIGAFLDWGLVKDLFLPFKEQTYRVRKGDLVPVALYSDKSSRLCATMRLYNRLQSQTPYKKDDIVNGYCYEIIENFGAYIAVDDRYSALIPKHRLFSKVLPGMDVTCHVVKVQEDGRLELSVRDKAYAELDDDGEMIFEILKEAGGFLPYHDKTSPELILAKFGLSKNAFKRAIGHLMKDGRIEILEDGIQEKK